MLFAKVDLTTLECSDVPVPAELSGLLPESLVSLDWTDPSIGLVGFGWWPVKRTEPAIDHDTHRLAGWTYQADSKTNTVAASAVIEPFPADVVEANVARKLADIRAQKMATINARCDEELSRLKTGYPEGEVTTWDQQVSEVHTVITAPGSPAPLLSAIASQRGIELSVLAARVQDKAQAYAVASGSIIGNRQKLEDQIFSAQTVEALEAVDVNAGWPA